MCIKIVQGKTVEEIVAEKSANMTDAQKAQYWFELSQNIYALLGKVEVPIIQLSGGWNQWKEVAQAQYPSLTNIQLPDGNYFTTKLESLQEILSRDYTNLIKYIADTFDCDKFANTLYTHLCQYYGINTVFPVWGQTTSGYHGFHCAVVETGGVMVARLIEPQSDAIFIEDGPLGKYTPEKTADFLAVMKK
jgi:hypothetical protein